MAKKNRLDTVVDLLRDQLRELEHEERDIQRAKARVLKAMHVFVKDDGSIPVSKHPNYKGPKGPIRRDSHLVMKQEIHGAFARGFVFHRNQAIPLGVAAGLRVGQAQGGFDTLRSQGWLHKEPKKGYYSYGGKDVSGGSAV